MTQSRKAFHRHALATAVVLALASMGAQAQLSTATVRGQVSRAGAAAQGGLEVLAVNQLNGARYRTATRADGSYVLAGLPPGSYELRVGGQKSQLITVSIGETAAIDLAVAADGGQQVTITGSLARKDVRNSEVGTSVSRKQIDSLPQISRNFLSFADLAPGVRFDTDRNGFVKVQSGAQNQDNINIFIDGVSQKNNILRGGASGMDSTRGNPFPQSAIAEYKVISQNYTAEFDQVSSAAITAVTKSGGNEVHGEVFVDHTGQNLTAYSNGEQQLKQGGVDRTHFSQNQYGVTIGGPIKQDVAHWFLSYEGKDIESPRTVGYNAAAIAAVVPGSVLAGLAALQGSHVQTFKENLLFGKIDLEVDANQHVELTARVRREKDHVPEDATKSAPDNEKGRISDETRLDLKHEWTRGSFLNEARLGYEQYEWSPNADNKAPEIKYFLSPNNTTTGASELVRTGGSPDAQNKKQTGWLFQDDLTYIGLAGHTIKGGAKVKLMTYDLTGSVRGVDIYQKLINNQTGNLVAFGANDYFQLDKATTPTTLGYKNKQFGIYLQDDWVITKRLEANLGIRWDYESNMLNNAYVTPADRVAALLGLEPVDANGKSTRNNVQGIPVTPGQTYAQSLAKGGINIGDYIANGAGRKSFTGAIQPRVGFSYDLLGDKRTVVFAGLGRAYDRTIADYAIAEMTNNAAAGGDVYLIRNGYKMPYTDQFSLGLRQAVSIWNTEIGYTHSNARNQFNWSEGNRDPLGGVNGRPPSDALFGGPAGFGNLVLGDFNGNAVTQTAYLKADKPYTDASGWGLGITYTYSDAKTTNNNLTNDPYNWTAGRSVSTLIQSADVERHRVVASGVTDSLLPWGLLLSGKATLGSGLPFRITNCANGFDTCKVVAGEGQRFRQFDVGIAKAFGLGMGKLTLRADVINLFNTVNYTGGYDGWAGAPTKTPVNYLGGDNAHLGVPDGFITGAARQVKLSVRYIF